MSTKGLLALKRRFKKNPESHNLIPKKSRIKFLKNHWFYHNLKDKRQSKHTNTEMNEILKLSDKYFKVANIGPWAAQSVKCPTLGFSSGHDLRVVRSSPTLGRINILFKFPRNSQDIPYSGL